MPPVLGGRTLRGPDGNVLASNLSQCFELFNFDSVRESNRRTWNSDKYKSHSFNMIAVTAKGAGGTGKTTCVWSLAVSKALAAHNVLVINADGQPSVEERILGKLVHSEFDSSFSRLYEVNGLEGQTLLEGLRGITRFAPPAHNQTPENILPDVIGVDVTKLHTQNHAGVGE